MAVLTEAIEAGEGAEVVTVTGDALVGIVMVTTTAPAATSTVAVGVRVPARARLVMNGTTVPLDGMMTTAALAGMAVAELPAAGAPVNPRNSTRMSATNGRFSCSNWLPA